MLFRRRLAFLDSSFGFRSDFVIRISSFAWQICRDACDDKDVYERNFEKEEPTEPHKLIVTKTGQRPAHPHKYENQGGDFCEEDCDVDQAEDPSMRAVGNSGEMP